MNIKIILSILAIAGIIAISGCVQQTILSTGGLDTRMSFDPPQVFSSRASTLYIDIENTDDFDYNNLSVDVFSTGSLIISEDCRKSFGTIKPNEIKHLECKLTAPSASALPENTQTETVYARVRFSKRLSGIQNIDMINEEEYTREIQTGRYATKPSSYTYQDSYLQARVSFSSTPPLIERPGSVSYMYIDITDIGSGFISSITQSNFNIVEVQNRGVVSCDVQNTLVPVKGLYPRISCELRLPSQINYINDYTTIINIDYDYELRKSATLTIVR